MAILLDGKTLAKKIQTEVAQEIEELKSKYNKVPGLAVVLVGDDPASQVYTKKKEQISQKVGINSRQIKLPASTSEEQLINTVETLNEDPDINAILIQLPLPKHINSEKILMTIKPEKDVDGFHPLNIGKLLTGMEPFAIPCTPLGIMVLMKEYNIELKGKDVVVVGRSNIVGKPISILLLAEHATVTICHSRTKNIDEVCKRADIIVVAIGKERFLKADWVKPGAVIIDVGINQDKETGKLCGDIDFENIEPLASYITPVPGGVGPMTIAILLKNTLNLFKKSLA